MMAAVVVLAVALAAFRAGVFAVIAACVALLAWKRIADAVAAGLATRFRQKPRRPPTSTSIAITIIGLSDLAFLLNDHASIEWLGRSTHVSHGIPRLAINGIIAAVVAGAVLSLSVAAVLRRTIGPRGLASSPTRQEPEAGTMPVGNELETRRA